MKKVIVLVFTLFFIAIASDAALAQGKGNGKGKGKGKGQSKNEQKDNKGEEANFKELEIVTSAQCGMCKEKIEGALGMVKGIKSADLNIESKIVRIMYNPEVVNSEFIRQTIASQGYDADGVEADKDAYKDLPKCCKKK